MALGGSSTAALTVQQQEYLTLLQEFQPQQIQQRRQRQTVVLRRQMLDLVRQGPEAIRTFLQDSQEDKRLLGVITAGKSSPALTDDLIQLLTDDNSLIRQAARRSLVRLSTWRDGKRGSRRRVDFGPATTAGRAAQGAAALRWQSWSEKQRTASLEGTTARTAR
jgi:hypothetical protein